jgi:hypothetical protein
MDPALQVRLIKSASPFLSLESHDRIDVLPLLWFCLGCSCGVEGFARCPACPCRRLPTSYPLSRQRAVDRAFHALFVYRPSRFFFFVDK